MSAPGFTKHRASAAAAEAEAAGLRWLAEPGCLPVPTVREVRGPTLVLDRLMAYPPTRAAARAFGRGLAELHLAGAPHFGFSPATAPDIADLSLPAGTWSDPATFLADARILPFIRLARDRGNLTPDQTVTLETFAARLPRLIETSEPPARCHGDLWSGNIIWQSATAGLIDPAAHGGHREADLAMLDLFGLPLLDEVISAYDEIYPLSPGWHERRRWLQVHPLLVHAVLFGGGYGAAAVAASQGSA